MLQNSYADFEFLKRVQKGTPAWVEKFRHLECAMLLLGWILPAQPEG